MKKLIIKTEKIKLLFLVGSLGTGGAERFVANALNLLPRKKYSLHAAFYRPYRSYDIPDYVSVKILHKYKPWHNFRACFSYVRWIDEIQPDIIISAWSVPNVFTAEALRWTKHKPIWIARIANAPSMREKGLYGLWARNSYKKADHFISVSSDLSTYFQSIYPFSKGKITVIHNATNSSELVERSEHWVPGEHEFEYLLEEKFPTIISVGRLEEQKRFDVLIRAFSKISQRITARLIILGEGSLRSDLVNLITNLNLHGKVFMPGFVKNPHALIAKSDLFVLSSDHEGMSNALIEAQALGKAAVATDCPFGTCEVVIHGKTGYLVQTGDVKAMADQIEKLLIDPELREQMGKVAALRIMQEFSLEKHVSSLDSLFAQLLKPQTDFDSQGQRA